MKVNNKIKPIHTHEGGKSRHINAEQQLRRSVMACMLWEKGFYESGQDIASRIAETIPKVDPVRVAIIANQARNEMHLRHAPLLIAREMARYNSHKDIVAQVLSDIICRPDELTEFMAIYWKDGKCPISNQIKNGLSAAFTKFDEYQLAKYNRDGAIKLRDVLFLCHAKPKDKSQASLWKRLVDNELKTPDTWEVALSSGGDKKEHWERLLNEKKLGGMALLRNLRNMDMAGVNESLVSDSILSMKTERILPFRFISAAKHAVHMEPQIETAMLKCLSGHEKIHGETVLLLDVSGSMDSPVSEKSQISRLDAGCGVAMLLREVCDKITILTFSMKLVRVPARRGFALRDAIVTSQEHSGTPLGEAIRCVYAPKQYAVGNANFLGYGRHEIEYSGQNLSPDRLIVITDEQSRDNVPDPNGIGYMINVASNQNGVGYGKWLHIDGWSEAVINYIQEVERESLSTQRMA
jgi:60 kDa SS-A/Ro ribonucleoprotein